MRNTSHLRYIVHEVPEAKPAILLAWADNSADLAAIKTAGQVTELPDNPHFWYWSISWFPSWSYHVLIGLRFWIGLALVGLGLGLGLRRIFTEDSSGISGLQCHHQPGICSRLLAKCTCLPDLQVAWIIDWWKIWRSAILQDSFSTNNAHLKKTGTAPRW